MSHCSERSGVVTDRHATAPVDVAHLLRFCWCRAAVADRGPAPPGGGHRAASGRSFTVAVVRTGGRSEELGLAHCGLDLVARIVARTRGLDLPGYRRRWRPAEGTGGTLGSPERTQGPGLRSRERRFESCRGHQTCFIHTNRHKTTAGFLTRRRRARPGHALGTRPAVSCLSLIHISEPTRPY